VRSLDPDVAAGLAIIAVVVEAFTIRRKPEPRLLWNASESVPIGLYSVEPLAGC
jgi:type IV secretory pathway protease TraF